MRLCMGDVPALWAAAYLDGVRQDACTMADDEEGVIRRYKLDAAGQFIITDGYAEREEVHGKVVIVLGAWADGNRPPERLP